MKRVVIREAEGTVLDYLVAVASGFPPEYDGIWYWMGSETLGAYTDANGKVRGFSPSSRGEHAIRIIEKEGISWHCGNKSNWHAYGYGSYENISGPTPLIAAMRCYVIEKLGEEYSVPNLVCSKRKLVG